MAKLLVFTDGGARGNPGPAAIGVVVKAETGKILTQFGRNIGEATNNVAEYQGVIAGLEWIRDNATMKQCNNETMVEFFLDSKLVVNQLNGMFKIKDSKLRNLLLAVRMLEQEIGIPVSYNLLPREKNWEADRLVNQALDNLVLSSKY